MNALIPITKIFPNPDQPRTVFDQAELEGLAQSIRENGLIQPVVVEKAGKCFILVDGERRWRACQMANLSEIEAVIRPASNHNGLQRLTQALVANIQRSSMGPVDEAHAYARLMEDLGTLEAVATKVGVSIATVSLRLSLLELPPPVQKLFNLKRLPLDLRVVAALKRLTPDAATKISAMAATRGWSPMAFRKLLAKGLKDVPSYQPTKRGKRSRSQILPVNGHFNALALTGGKSFPGPITEAAVQTCSACSLYEEASPTICKQCPLPDYLNRLEVRDEE